MEAFRLFRIIKGLACQVDLGILILNSFESYKKRGNMRKILAVSAALTLTLSISGCSGLSAEQACSDYIKAYGQYLADVMEGSTTAVSNFSSKLNELANSAPTEIGSAMKSDSMNVSNSFETATACAP